MSLTAGAITKETESALAFDAILGAVDLFKVYPEVPGTLVQPKPAQRDRGMRIDRLLVPNERLIGLGWTHGIVGVELKRSGVRLGPAIAQALDYSRSVFTLPAGGFQVWPTYVFIWPADKEHGDTASVLAQNRLGTASHTPWALLHLASGEQTILRVNNDRTVHIGAGGAGVRAGSR